MPSADENQFLMAVANETRLKILLGTRAERLTRHVDLLIKAGLIAPLDSVGYGQRLVLTTSWLKADNVVVGRLKRPATRSRGEDEGSRVLATFVKDGRLVRFPAALKKKLVVLEWIASLFEVDRRFAERDVNAVLSNVHADFATLRRALIDHGFMRRDHGVYWRPGAGS